MNEPAEVPRPVYRVEDFLGCFCCAAFYLLFAAALAALVVGVLLGPDPRRNF